MTKEVVVPISENGRPMSPFEQRTGVVLPIWGPPDGDTNRHHAHFYRRLYEQGPPHQQAFLRAIRFTRLQRVTMANHQLYHNAFEGTLFPSSKKSSFITTILNEAGYIPPWVVDITNGEPIIAETTVEMRQELRRPGIFTIERSPARKAEIGQFLMHYALEQDLGHVKESLLEEFASLTHAKIRRSARRRARKLELGMKLTNIAIGVAVEPVERPFQQARDALALREEAPICAFQEVKQFVDGREPEYYNIFRQKIADSLAA